MQNTENELIAKAEAGNAEARYLYTTQLASTDLAEDKIKLLELAEKEWCYARKIVAEGYAKGLNGFKQDRDKLMELANKGWKAAQVRVLIGLVLGCYGFDLDQDCAKDLDDEWSKYW